MPQQLFAFTSGSLAMFRYRRFHSSLFIGLSCAGVLVGLLAGRNSPMHMPLELVAIVAIASVMIAWKKPTYIGGIAVVIAGFFVGMARGDSFSHELSLYDQYIGQTVTMSARLSDDPTKARD